ncbi:TetR/AcrR family transcriptional regulator [Streptomyces adustus]|uniref:TetR/AcrR family transcriptional regulator n=1 Tax=Streptomyces adustus TaxID=1609272 RepID=A0A5N8V6G2_9ACTN|nr:TetR family transcriptional regulator [Streptomyces adustus]MPY30773.1 TetR/AcrR family transcriptional regulator [Streptomyces adustus]
MTPSTGADSTRDRIVTAATAEFSRHGIAGARIERIAKAARTSKERLYAYFRSKEELYATVAADELTAVAEATRLDPTDLPGYAGRVHDYFTAHPDRLRLMNWGRLELGDGRPAAPDDPIQTTVRHKTEQLRNAQKAGHLDPAWDPADILVFVNQLAMSWAGQTDLMPADETERVRFLSARRAAIVAAVQRLFPAATVGQNSDLASPPSKT